MQKQAGKWPVSFYSNHLDADIKARIQQIWQADLKLFYDPFAIELAIDDDIKAEYGLDCCRLAQIEAQGANISISLLEAAYKWLNKLSKQLNEASKPDNFDAAIWFEAILQAKDHILKRDKLHSGLACIKKALKTMPVSNGLEAKDLQLVLSCLYPFIPVTGGYYLQKLFSSYLPATVSSIFAYYPDLIMIHYCIGNGGWHWTVLNKDQFETSPLKSLKRIKPVRLATKNKNACLKKVSQGYLICLN
jgi:hypothetical protein